MMLAGYIVASACGNGARLAPFKLRSIHNFSHAEMQGNWLSDERCVMAISSVMPMTSGAA